MGKNIYYVVNKPFGMLCQFSKEKEEHVTLADLGEFPKDVYPVGRLDKDSEGLLILTNDKSINALILDPQNKKRKTYFAQVEGEPTPERVEQLRSGVKIKVNKKVFKTGRAEVSNLKTEPVVPERMPPIRFRKSIPTYWLSLTITEGKNRQVRRMCAKVDMPVLRLIRMSIEDLNIDGLNPGEFRIIDQNEILDLLGL